MTSDPHRNETVLAGKYRLERRIGTGGMGTIYRAVHDVLHRPVAVKLVEVQGSDPHLAERFLREARVAASVRHPNVVDILDFGTSDAGQPFMVMELLEGESLMHRMMDGPELTTHEQVLIVGQVLLGLDAVHRAGIIHRDLKPANVFLTPHDDGTIFARLLDFGISYSIDPGSQLRRGRFGTDERLVMGTPEYMSPEQAEGRPDVDVRSDVWAMGVILYELLTNGQLPYADPNPGGVLFKVMSGGHRPLVEWRPDIPEIAEVVEAALSRDRDERPATARDMRRLLLSASGMAIENSGMHARGDRVSLTSLRPISFRAERPTVAQQTASLAPPRTRTWWIAPMLAVTIAGLALLWAALHTPEPIAMEPAETEVDRPAASAPAVSVGVSVEPAAPPLEAADAPTSDAAPEEAVPVRPPVRRGRGERGGRTERPERGAVVRDLDF